MSKQSSPKLTCAQCGYENEPERVYCHNCGTKLDRSVLPKETASQQENLAATRRRIRRMTSPGQGMAFFKTLVRTLIWAALVAIIYLLVSPPQDLPTKDDEAGANVITGDIDMAVDNPASSTVQFTQADVSSHLRSRIKAGPGVIPGLQLKRPYVQLADGGKARIGMEQVLWGYSLYPSVEYRVTAENGKWKAEKLGFRAGRLGIHPAIPGVEEMFTKTLAGLKQERALLERAQQIAISKGRVVIVTRPGR
jgi:hypothetical protein